MKSVHIFLLGLILVGLGLLSAQRIWINPLVTWILHNPNNIVAKTLLTAAPTYNDADFKVGDATTSSQQTPSQKAK